MSIRDPEPAEIGVEARVQRFVLTLQSEYKTN
jgi:hypothetical protein